MSKLLSYTIEYEVTYTAGHVLALVEVINEAVLENWDRYRDQWTEASRSCSR